MTDDSTHGGWWARRRGLPSRGLWVSLLPPLGIELAGTVEGIHWLGVDLQHGELELTELPALLRATSLPVLARTGSHEPAVLARILDTGVDGVLVATVETEEQARKLVRATRVPPWGCRSTGWCRAGLHRSDRLPLLLPMIETRAGVENAAEIAAVDGVDGVFLGPYDLAISLGADSVLAAEVIGATAAVVSRVRALGRIVGAFSGDARLTALLPELDILAVDSDAAVLRRGLTELFAAPSAERRAS